MSSYSSLQRRLSRGAFLRVLGVVSGLFLSMGAARAAELDLVVMSYNIRVPLDKTPNSWPERRDAMAACIRTVDPDLIGLQEALVHQMDDLTARLPQYAVLGKGREGGNKGEHSSLLYRRDKFTVLEHGDFWLSDTPTEAGSMTWGNKLPRMVSWARFRENQTGREFQWFNTHFDHQSQPSRERSAELLRDRVKALKADLPVIVTGDFNSGATKNPAYTILTKGADLVDTWLVAKEVVGKDINSFNGFSQTVPSGGTRIDWVLVRGKVDVSKAALLTYSENGRFPSDHFPAVAWLKLQD